MDSTKPPGAPLPTPPSGMRSLSARVLEGTVLDRGLEAGQLREDGPPSALDARSHG